MLGTGFDVGSDGSTIVPAQNSHRRPVECSDAQNKRASNAERDRTSAGRGRRSLCGGRLNARLNASQRHELASYFDDPHSNNLKSCDQFNRHVPLSAAADGDGDCAAAAK